MRKLHALAGGRARVWWLTHRHEARTAGLFLILSALFVGYSEVRLFAERGEKNELVKMLGDERVARVLPNTVYIIEAATVSKAQEKLARIAGELDVARYEMGRKK